ncbi:hypothetical protein ETB97_011743 [Aspergillus alliaceus]|uniref:Uncharacterized protein n=1 Tax=Petromyces alliaceus TaxID=209559 RepID=A0A8H6A8B7_PETAA|nr:hypothetical protein ETB97_011743 [Aspergillus burnettii]
MTVFASSLLVEVDNIDDNKYSVSVYENDDCTGSIVGTIQNTNGCLYLHAFNTAAGKSTQVIHITQGVDFVASRAANGMTVVEAVLGSKRSGIPAPVIQTRLRDLVKDDERRTRELALKLREEGKESKENSINCGWLVLCVHKVVAKPSAKCIYQRRPGLKFWIRVVSIIVLEAIIYWLVKLYTLELTISPYNRAGFIDVENLDLEGIQALRRGYKPDAIGLTPSFITYMATLPVRTVSVRLEASTLPDDDEPIVPLDPRLKSNPPTGILDTWRDIPDREWSRVWRWQTWHT